MCQRPCPLCSQPVVLSPLDLQTKTGVVLLHDEVSGNAYAVRLKLTKEVLTVQTQDVICVSASSRSANVSASASQAPALVTVSHADESHESPLMSPVIPGCLLRTRPCLCLDVPIAGLDCHKAKH